MFYHIPTLLITLMLQPDCLYHNNFLILQSDPFLLRLPQCFLIAILSEQIHSIAIFSLHIVNKYHNTPNFLFLPVYIPPSSDLSSPYLPKPTILQQYNYQILPLPQLLHIRLFFSEYPCPRIVSPSSLHTITAY